MVVGTAQQLVKTDWWSVRSIHLLDAPTKLMKGTGYGDEYKYSHDYANNFAEQGFFLRDE
jgi:putative ATPase